MINTKKKLATTAISEFWDECDNLIFLGEWCKINLSTQDPLLSKPTFDFLWNKKDKINEAANICNETYLTILPKLAETLNHYHATQASERYWNIILGNWLHTFIQVVWDRYQTLNAFILENPDFETILLNKMNYITPLDYNDFIAHVVDDGYNLQLYSQILSFMGYQFPTKHYALHQNNILKNKKNRKKSYVLSLLNLFLLRPETTLTGPYFDHGLKSYLKIFFYSKGNIYFNEFDENYQFTFNKYVNRNLLFAKYQNEDNFISLLFTLFESNLPSLFLEGFKEFNNFACSRQYKVTSNYVTSNSFHSNNLYKFWIAGQLDKIKVACIQHGGGYGIDLFNAHEQYERNIANVFYTWGWKDDHKTISLTHEKLSSHSKPNKDGYILFCSTSYPKYIIRYQNSYSSSSIPLIYIPQTISFFSMLNYRENTLVRGYPTEYGYSMTKELSERFDSITIDNHSESFNYRLQEARLFVCDHMQTTYLETLVMNFPTVIFIDSEFYAFKNSNHINKLIDAKILFTDPIKAANHINAIYHDIDTWWYASDVQKAREEFCTIYANSSKNWAKDWIKAFNRLK